MQQVFGCHFGFLLPPPAAADRTKITHHIKCSRAVWVTARKHLKPLISAPLRQRRAPKKEMTNNLFDPINALETNETQARLHRRPFTSRREQLTAIAGETACSPDNAEAARGDLWREYCAVELFDISTR